MNGSTPSDIPGGAFNPGDFIEEEEDVDVDEDQRSSMQAQAGSVDGLSATASGCFDEGDIYERCSSPPLADSHPLNAGASEIENAAVTPSLLPYENVMSFDDEDEDESDEPQPIAADPATNRSSPATVIV